MGAPELALSRQLVEGQRAVALMPGHSSAEAQRLAPTIAKYLEEKRVQVLREPDTSEGLGIVLSLGGDGLMMRAARRYPDVPILAINFGHFGFLTAAEASNWRSAIDRVLTGNFQVRVGPTLATQVIPSAGGPLIDLGWAVNDVVVHGGLRYIHPALYIDGQYVNEYPGDGIVLSTPAGSTAYCMAAGGPVLLSGVGGFAIVPMNCHSPIRVSMVVPEDVEMSIKLEGRHGASLILDGESEKLHGLTPGDRVQIRRGAVCFRNISFRSFDWFTAFQSKFNYEIRRAARDSNGPAREVTA